MTDWQICTNRPNGYSLVHTIITHIYLFSKIDRIAIRLIILKLQRKRNRSYSECTWTIVVKLVLTQKSPLNIYRFSIGYESINFSTWSELWLYCDDKLLMLNYLYNDRGIIMVSQPGESKLFSHSDVYINSDQCTKLTWSCSTCKIWNFSFNCSKLGIFHLANCWRKLFFVFVSEIFYWLKR